MLQRRGSKAPATSGGFLKHDMRVIENRIGGRLQAR